MKFIITLFVVALVAVADANSSSEENSKSNCPKMCARMWRPVCAEVDGIPVSISNNCTLDSLIHCTNDDTQVWEFLHNGLCQSDNETYEEEEYAWDEIEDNEINYVYETYPEEQFSLGEEYEVL